ncbi:probable palmitoyltransferase ZDHHC24 [Saccostrea echinata]|uniref:probable palmitoyltransferase ZDHHC24 n=1 Tax=Saccostrea echinata TaxID=191078 RepID=UPI002A804627|nr:probable palmitoyltransferase ZDHHC24 [Saccostrea echinata]
MDVLLQNYVPRRTIDRIMFVYLLLLVHNIMFYLFYIVLPWRKENYGTSDLTIYLYEVWILFLYVNVMGGTWRVVMTNTTTKGIVLPSVLKQGWTYCYFCQTNAPPRSYHCGICNVCVLKRDHHCIYTGRCIGYFNYRYYLTILFYSLMLAVFTSTMSMSLAWDMLGDFSAYNLLGFIFPIVMFVFGVFNFYKAYTVLMSFIATLFSVMLSILTVWHIKHVCHNMTTYERRHGIYTYDLGLWENLRQILGKNWRVSWLCPFIPSPLPGDGLEFPTKGSYESPKDL